MNFYKRIGKRTLDVALSFCALIILSPFLAIIALIVKIKLGSPVIFKQERAGLIKGDKESHFKLFKFRSMLDAVDSNGNPLPDTARLTKFGRILRATSLDELPELLNILKGDMSIVGPRPLPVLYLSYYTRKEHQRHTIKPGLTGLAQVSGRNALSWDDKFKFDLEYVEKCSFLFDCKIIFMTVRKVFKREGIGQGEEAPLSLHIERKDWLDKNGKIKAEFEKSETDN